MNSVFIGGSRAISRLSRDVRDRFDSIIEKDLAVLIGDANGADKSVQKYFQSSGYRCVKVYCSGSECRNNLGLWEEVHVDVTRKKKDRQYYGAKDLQMAKDCSYGLMLWDGKSSGTLNNVLNILDLSKQCMFYISPERKFIFLSSFKDFSPILKDLPAQMIDELSRKIDLRDRTEGLIPGSQQRLNI